MENLSGHRDRANKMDSNELRTTRSIHVWVREMPALGELARLSASPWSDSAVAMPNQRAVRHQREALQIAIKPRLVGRETYGVRTEALLRLSRRPRTGL